MNAPALAQAIERMARHLNAGLVHESVQVLLVPEARYLRLSARFVSGELVVDACVGATPDEAGTCQSLLRGDPASVRQQLAAAGLVDRLAGLAHELMRACAWSEQMLLPRAHAPPPRPDGAALKAQRLAVLAALEREIALPQPWQISLSPPLPAAWPMVLGVPLSSYAAATRSSSSSPTLFEHTEPLARVVHDPLCRSAPEARRLVATVEVAGIASVIPLMGSELSALQSLPPLDACWAGIAAGIPDAELSTTLKTHLRFQRRRAAWLWEHLRLHHADLFAWIEAE